ncbi:MAG: hypothetical protein KatS3mg111_3548 [Pirellulaceae bacterium]|nr:MAG: hypothetical protein KatS3mg111_3548 [Pirellulaceae bacterium]
MSALQGEQIPLEEEDSREQLRPITVTQVRDLRQPHPHLGIYHPVISGGSLSVALPGDCPPGSRFRVRGPGCDLVAGTLRSGLGPLPLRLG